MAEILQPPSAVRGMLELDRSAFTKGVALPALRVPKSRANNVFVVLDPYFLRMRGITTIRELPTSDGGRVYEVLLNPVLVRGWQSLPEKKLKDMKITVDNFFSKNVALNYENWEVAEIFHSVLPAGAAIGYIKSVGHLLEVNLCEQLIAYKQLIGQVLLDKQPGCHSVINKRTIFDREQYRVDSELLAGAQRFRQLICDNNTTFEFDYSRVHWDPRFKPEHARMRRLVNSGDVLYDLYAGIGQYALPIARKGCAVMANELNAEHYRWLKQNLMRYQGVVCKIYKKTAQKFIDSVVRKDLIERWQHGQQHEYNLHVLVSVPEAGFPVLAPLRGLFSDAAEASTFDWIHLNPPYVHIYCYNQVNSEDDTKLLALNSIKTHLGVNLYEEFVTVEHVLMMEPLKHLFRVDFQLNKTILMASKPSPPVAAATQPITAKEHQPKVLPGKENTSPPTKPKALANKKNPPRTKPPLRLRN